MDYEAVIDTLEDKRFMHEEIYKLESLKTDYGTEPYTQVMAQVHSANWDQARKILQDLEEAEDQ